MTYVAKGVSTSFTDDACPNVHLCVGLHTHEYSETRLTIVLRDTARNEDIWRGELDDLVTILEEWKDRQKVQGVDLAGMVKGIVGL